MSSERYFFILFQKKHLTSLVLLLFVYQGDLLETNLYRVLYFASITSLPYQQFDQRETVRFFVHIHSPYHEFLPIKVVGKAVVPAAGDGSPHFRKFTRSSTAASAIAARGTATVESEL